MGKTTTFIMEGRQENLGFARTAMHALATASLSCVIFDLDAFYSSNAEVIFAELPGDTSSFIVNVPAPGSDIESEFSALFGTEQKVVVIDSLNSLYHLISAGDVSSRGRKLMFALACLSQFARSNGVTVILCMYRREGFARSGKGRSISTLSDIAASVGIRGPYLEIRTERGPAWPGGAYSSRVP